MEVHVCLWNEVEAFHFAPADLEAVRQAFPDASVVCHQSSDAFLSRAAAADYLLTWEFAAQWYAHCPRLKAILTPAAGRDWVEPDPEGRVPVIHGTFHGDILAESLLGAVLYMNHRGPAMAINFAARNWDRNLQSDTRLLRNQLVLIIGFGSIGSVCGELIRHTGAQVIGVTRSGVGTTGSIPVHAESDLPRLLPRADHVVLLLPGERATDGFMDEARIRQCKPGVILYNFGRGNALTSADLLAAGDHIGGAYLDVTDEEPLPASSLLWDMDNIMITPHSSCVYREYREYFLNEAIARIKARTKDAAGS